VGRARPRLAALAVAGVLALAPALVACGDDDGGSGTTTATASAPPPTSTTLTATSPTSTAGAPDSARLETVLLTARDLGGDWTATAASGETGRLCGVEPLDARAAGEARAEFVSRSGRARLEHVAYAYPAGVAEEVMAAAAAGFADCDETVAGPPQTRFRLSGLPAPALGDEAVAFEGAVDQEGTALRVRGTLIRRSSLVAIVFWTGLEDPDPAVLDPLLAEADQRLFMLAGA